MAPPRSRPAPNLDDSRSEASSTKERPGAGNKGRKVPNTGPIKASKDLKVTAAATVSAGAANPPLSELPGMQWSNMPLSILHDYRHAYRVPSPSAFSTPLASIVLRQGIGLQSPTAIAARRAQLSRNGHKSKGGLSSTNRGQTHGGNDAKEERESGKQTEREREVEMRRVLSGIRGQGRVSKDHLALAVRKHFNSVGLNEPEAIARFLYKVREEGKGREFRLRFQP